ncbi:MAG: hypothetical protein HQ565_02905 [Bacteroidetes bacterium]|nr:hypothetical protein [Bacteroidota bacterium]
MKTMKFARLGVLLLSVMFVFASCEKDKQAGIANNDAYEMFKELGVVDLIAAQNIIVGDVTVTNNSTHFFVAYHVTDPDYCLIETHMHIAPDLSGIPQTKKGNPKIGKFNFQEQHECISEFTYTVQIPVNWEVGKELVIAAHAVVQYVSDETAWGEGTSFPGSSWAMYFPYIIQE